MSFKNQIDEDIQNEKIESEDINLADKNNTDKEVQTETEDPEDPLELAVGEDTYGLIFYLHQKFIKEQLSLKAQLDIKKAQKLDHDKVMDEIFKHDKTKCIIFKAVICHLLYCIISLVLLVFLLKEIKINTFSQAKYPDNFHIAALLCNLFFQFVWLEDALRIIDNQRSYRKFIICFYDEDENKLRYGTLFKVLNFCLLVIQVGLSCLTQAISWKLILNSTRDDGIKGLVGDFMIFTIFIQLDEYIGLLFCRLVINEDYKIGLSVELSTKEQNFQKGISEEKVKTNIGQAVLEQIQKYLYPVGGIFAVLIGTYVAEKK